MNTITDNYIDKALSKLKICKQYGTGYFDNPLPKGCVYGRPTRNIYIYIDNLWQFDPQYELTQFVIWILDARKDTQFHKTLVSKHTEWYNMIFAFIDYHNLFNAKVEPNLYRMGKKPERKQPQGYNGYTYNVPYRHRKVLEWENTFTTETDAIYKPAMYVDKKKVQKIKDKQQQIDTFRKKHLDKYK